VVGHYDNSILRTWDSSLHHARLLGPFTVHTFCIAMQAFVAVMLPHVVPLYRSGMQAACPPTIVGTRTISYDEQQRDA
jgi:hypothetical protein